MLPSTSPRQVLFAWPPSPPRSLSSFIVVSTFSSPCSHSDSSLSSQDAALAHLHSLPPHDLVIWTDGSFPFGKSSSGVLANSTLHGTEATLSFSAGPVCLSLSIGACTILHALCWSWQHQQVCHFSDLTTLSSLHLFFYLKLSGKKLEVKEGNDAADELARQGVLLVFSAIPCSLYSLISPTHSSLFSEWRSTVSSKFFDTQIPCFH